MQRARGTDRILDILECLARLNRPVGRAEIALETEMPRSTVYALCDLLITRGWLEDQDGQIALGRQAGFVSNSYLRTQSFETLARDLLRRLAIETETLTEINVVEDWLHVVALSEGRIAQGYIRPIEGARIPLTPTAAARILLADVPEDFVMRHIRDEDLRDVSDHAVSRAAFFADIELSRTRGYATIAGWFDGTLSTLAVPVQDPEGRTIASLCMILPTRATDERLDHYLGKLREGARELAVIMTRLPWTYGLQCWHDMREGLQAPPPPEPGPAMATGRRAPF